MEINDMDKYELTKAINKAGEIISDPNINFHFRNRDRNHFLEIIEEIKNPPTDKEGYVHKYYLKDGTKDLIEVLLRKSSF